MRFPFDPGPTTIEIPWLFIVGFACGVPLLAALVAGVRQDEGMAARRLT
ncbi:hypothetical protein HD597_000738 [Nonomuraea thailandensis]|uniref:Uncharacterized protein n=1 Tax=Nonomuraea thailandensis TaxID=1188745 RepID=A0A9X2GFJ5_9ACTN|nr:hypothetical protein [Nonomuraea thailandensis]